MSLPGLNYFTLLSVADKELAHSAMIAFLLREPFFARSVFPAYAPPIDPALRS
jgi:hypothetical protein